MHAPLAVNVLSARDLVSTFGELGVMVVLFVETGLLIGLVLPGDSLLFVAGFAASGGVAGVHLQLGYLLPAAVVGAVVGAQVGYEIGRRSGPPLFDRPDSRLFKRRYVDRADAMFERFGPGKAIVLARFVPVVRTLLNPFAGIVEVPRNAFALWNVLGGIVWTVGVALLGYFLGQVSFLNKHLELVVLAVVAVSLIPIAVELVRETRRSRRRDTAQVPAEESRDGA